MPNRLVHETSPYLLQHANNPVEWYPWGEDAFEKARGENKPIFLSVGYSACHWCHVMERESFEDEEVARLLNESFVSVKVDREERPDVDAIYMTAVQMMARQGGWPMSVFLTPELKPFFGGTYFPPRSMHGRPGFTDLLRQMSHLWETDRKKVEDVAGRCTEALQADQPEEGVRPARGEAPPGPEVLEQAYEHDRRTFDSTFGGFGEAPKFPRSVELSRLLIHYHHTGEKQALEMVEVTLKKMARGGMYDQIGGGFHRYSVDKQWLVPHFEKMLYDNALLARTYLEGYQVTGDDFYRRVATEILDYVLREMTSREGGFYSATDADSEGEEGKFFVWSTEEIEEILGQEKARPFCLHYGITVGGNFEAKNIPHIAKPLAEVAVALGMEPGQVEKILEEGRDLLYRERAKRVKPFRDEKQITSWNSLMISALARASLVTGEDRYLQAARRAAKLIEESLTIEGKIHRIYKDGSVRIPGYLDDHSYFLEALIDLYEATFDPLYLARARDLCDRMIADFWDDREGGFFFTALHHRELIARRKDPLDNATPSANGVAALALLRLERLTGVADYRVRAEKLLTGLKNAIEQVPMGFGYTLIALDFYQNPAVEVALLGNPAEPETRAALRLIGQRLIPRRVLAGAPGKVEEKLAREIPLLEGREPIQGKPAVYICEDFACQAPITDLEELERQLGKLSAPSGN